MESVSIQPKPNQNPTIDLSYIAADLQPLAVPIDEPTLDPANAREGHDLDGIAASLRVYGQRKPIVINSAEGNRTLAGNGTLRAARSLGWSHIAAVRVEEDATAATGYAIADNKLGDTSYFNQETLAQLLGSLPPEVPTGFGDEELAAILAEHHRPNAPEGGHDAEPREDEGDKLREKWGVEVGQMWVLRSRVDGQEHRIICGDCTDAAVVGRLMQNDRAIFFATDPPYLVSYDGTNHPHEWGKPDKNKDWSESYHDWDSPDATNDDSADNGMTGEELYDGFIETAIAHAIRPNAAWYCWHASRRQKMLEEVWERHGALFHQQIIWMKSRPVLTRSWYMYQHEPCFMGWLKGNKPPRSADNYPATVWEIESAPPGTKTLHPTSKPLPIFEIPMQQHTKVGDICYEPFSGSGSQLIAAENLGRQCRAVELQPQYVAVALDRYERAFGITAELVDV